MLVDIQNAQDPHGQSVRALIPDEVSRHYQILGKIGAGGSACVYRACVRQSPERLVAVKLLHHPLTEPELRRAFERECVALERLRGTPGIMAVHQTGVSQEGQAWIVSDLYTTSYRTRTRSLGCIPSHEVTRAGARIARALAVAHAKGILHRDLKPGNLFINSEGLVVLGDFGSAIDTERTLTTNVSLSLQFAAPETLQKGAYSISTDLYSPGSSLYYILAGRLPFAGARSAALNQPVGEHLHRITHTSALRLDTNETPPALIELVYRLMSTDPAGRPATALEVASQLDRMSESTGAVALEHYSGERLCQHTETPLAPRPSTTRLKKTVLLAGFCALGIGLLIGTTQRPTKSSISQSQDRLKVQPTPVTRDTAATESGVCAPSSLLCEDFEMGLASWRDESDSRIASLETAVGGWSGNALLFEPGDILKKGASSTIQRFIAPLPGEPLRIRARMKPEQPGPAYW